jgi:pSer/pThr/pTyr-binding forkhead associated (FHA) protein
LILLSKDGRELTRFALREGVNQVGVKSVGEGIFPDVDLSSVDNDQVVSRRHAILRVSRDHVTIADCGSTNGTYVDGMRLPPHEPYLLRGGEEIQIGDIRLIYHPPSAVAELMVSEETTQRVVLSRATFRAELTGPDMAVAPGAHAQAVLTVENTSEAPDQYFLEIDGLPKGWVRIDRVELTLDPGEAGQAVLSFKPLRRSETRPGDYPFVVRARARSKPAETIDVPAVLSVLPYSGFGMALDDEHVAFGEPFKIYLHNQGNTPLTLDLGAVDPASALHVQFAAQRVQLGPGERQAVRGEVYPRHRRLWGGPVQREFFVIVRSHDPSGFIAAVPGTVTERGMLPTWLPLLLIPVVMLGLFAVALLGLWLLGGEETPPPRAPVISAFTAAPDQVVVGEAVTFSWAVQDASGLALRVFHGGGEQVVAVPADTVTYAMSFDESGRYTIALEAQGGGQLVTQSLTVSVRPAVALSVEVLGGAELVRNVSQEVQLTWEVRGARPYQGGYRIRVTGSDRRGDLLVSPMPLTGQQRVTVVPGNDQVEWLVTLYAEGFDGLVTSIVQEAAVLPKKLAATRAFAAAVADIEQQLARLFPKGFIVDTPPAQLAHYPRYLKAIALRLDKLKADPARDAQRMGEIARLQTPYLREVAARKGVVDPRLQEFRWLLEELRVSLFAQELRTPMPVSVKRLERAWESARR